MHRHPSGHGPRTGRSEPIFDVVTPTPAEQERADLRARQRRYLRLMALCLGLVVFGFFVPAPIFVRAAALAVAAVIPPLAAIVGNARRLP